MFADPSYGDYYLSPGRYDAPLYRSRRRQTEHAAKAGARSPSPTFKAVGADNVATGSMAGMRLLHALKQALGQKVAIWPFDQVVPSRPPVLVLVEIFPSWYFHAVGMNPAKNAAVDPHFMCAALAAWDSHGVSPGYAPRGADADEADAMISAAALRRIATAPGNRASVCKALASRRLVERTPPRRYRRDKPLFNTSYGLPPQATNLGPVPRRERVGHRARELDRDLLVLHPHAERSAGIPRRVRLLVC